MAHAFVIMISHGQAAAIIYTLLVTAKRHEVEVCAYLKDVLTHIPDYPHHKLVDVLP